MARLNEYQKILKLTSDGNLVYKVDSEQTFAQQLWGRLEDDGKVWGICPVSNRRISKRALIKKNRFIKTECKG